MSPIQLCLWSLFRKKTFTFGCFQASWKILFVFGKKNEDFLVLMKLGATGVLLTDLRFSVFPLSLSVWFPIHWKINNRSISVHPEQLSGGFYFSIHKNCWLSVKLIAAAAAPNTSVEHKNDDVFFKRTKHASESDSDKEEKNKGKKGRKQGRQSMTLPPPPFVWLISMV